MIEGRSKAYRDKQLQESKEAKVILSMDKRHPAVLGRIEDS
jgi:hypothetical protein